MNLVYFDDLIAKKNDDAVISLGDLSHTGMDIVKNFPSYRHSKFRITESDGSKYLQEQFDNFDMLKRYVQTYCQKNKEKFTQNISLTVTDEFGSEKSIGHITMINTLWSILKGRGNWNRTERNTLPSLKENKWRDYPKFLEELIGEFIGNYTLNPSDEPEKIVWTTRNRKNLHNFKSSFSIPGTKGRNVLDRGKVVEAKGIFQAEKIGYAFYDVVDRNAWVFSRIHTHLKSKNHSGVVVYLLKCEGQKALLLKPMMGDRVVIRKFDNKKYSLCAIHMNGQQNKLREISYPTGENLSQDIIWLDKSKWYLAGHRTALSLRDLETKKLSELIYIPVRGDKYAA